MSLRLGIDTGGTYTDAVLLDDAQGVLAKAKALTTKHALIEGVREAVRNVLAGHAAQIGLVGLSTTLATNALVEGHGAPVGLLMIGFGEDALDRAGLRKALGQDPVTFVAGGHDANGSEVRPLDREAVATAVRALAGRVDAFAVTGLFGVRNPAHERAAAEIAREIGGRPTTCSHELTSRLDAPRRALTTLLNARLIGDIHRLIGDVRALLEECGITAPLMVVKGDGSLVAADTARLRPVETILSGPAASVVGAAFLSGERDVVVSDIGGTTTDVAFLRDGKPEVDEQGARVGGWRTMVEALRVHTWGLGGDSEVRRGEDGRLVLGPRRVVPVSLLAASRADVLEQLREQAARPVWKPQDGRFALRLRRLADDGASLGRSQRELWEKLAAGPLAVEAIVDRLHMELPLRRLVERGAVILSSFTPSDAAHVLGLQSGWPVEAARLGATLRGRFESLAAKNPSLAEPEAFATLVMRLAERRTAEVLIRSALAEEGLPSDEVAGSLGSALIDAALSPDRSSLVRPRLALDRPVVAIGGPAALIYPGACALLDVRAIVPPHAEVSNAVGAVAGNVVQTVRITVTAPDESRFRVHLDTGPTDLRSLEAALERADEEARRLAESRAREAGADEVAVTVEREVKVADGVEGRRMFVEATLTARASGRPGMAPPRPPEAPLFRA